MLRILIFLFLTFPLFSQEYFLQYSYSPAGTNVREMEADSLGNLYAVGRGGITPGCDSSVTASTGTAYLAKFDRIGNVIWRHNFGGNAAGANGLDIDKDGNVLVTGYQGRDFFVMKMSADGTILWDRTVGGQSTDDMGTDIVSDAAGNIYVTGHFNFTVNFGGQSLTAHNFKDDPFVWSINSSGGTRWVKQIKSRIDGTAQKIIVDAEGNILTTGRYTDDNFDVQIYIWKLSPDGSEIFFKGIEVTNRSHNHGLAADARNNIYLTGHFADSLDFDPGPDEHILPHTGSSLSNDGFILKLNQNGDFDKVYVIEDSFGAVSGRRIDFDEDGNIFHSGIFGDKVDFDPGPDVFELTTHPQASNIFIQKLDSALNFQYVMHVGNISSSQGYDSQAFDYGADGRLYLGRENPQGFVRGIIEAFGDCETKQIYESFPVCRSFFLNGMEVTSDCEYRTSEIDSLTGCEIITRRDFEIAPQRTVGVTYEGDSLSSSHYSLLYTHWLDCDDGFKQISGENGQVFYPEKTGTYAVEVLIDYCVDTSDCVFIEIESSGTSVENNFFTEPKIYPNPFSERINIRDLPVAFAEISIFDLNGKLILKKEKPIGISEFEISTADLSEGVFLIFIKNEGGVFRRVITKTDW